MKEESLFPSPFPSRRGEMGNETTTRVRGGTIESAKSSTHRGSRERERSSTARARAQSQSAANLNAATLCKPACSTARLPEAGKRTGSLTAYARHTTRSRYGELSSPEMDFRSGLSGVLRGTRLCEQNSFCQTYRAMFLVRTHAWVLLEKYTR